MIYNRTAVLTFSVAGSTAAAKHYITCPGDFMIKKLWVQVAVAGSQATHKVQLTNVANSVTYAEVTTGTSAAGTVVSDSVEEDDRYFTGGTVVVLRNVVNDATASYHVSVLIAHQE
jgi:outer membrane protein W